MEIVYITDVHDYLRGLKKVFQVERPDLFLISGDLIYKAFLTQEKLYHFAEIQDYLYQYTRRYELATSVHELCEKITQKPENYSLKLQQYAREYLNLEQQAVENMKRRYALLRSLAGRYATTNVFFLPGNYDMDLQYTALAAQDMHKKMRKIMGISIAGYGGAPVYTPGIPERISVVFHEYHENNLLMSEPREFFRRTQPEILLIHNPAYGTLDRLASYGHCGSLGIREFIDEHPVRLVLSGHVHEDYGLLKIGQTFFLNPSNFGPVDTIYGPQEGGYFCRIQLQKDEKVYVRRVSLMRLYGEEIYPVLHIKIDRNLRCQEIIENEAEFQIIKRFLR
ncbi:MAG: metallophosphoesterase [Leptospiraceae bacterium]|nr:metallophosphoesterase [Leptospiraceae bacterium]